MAMLLEIQAAAARKETTQAEHRAAILRLIGGDSLEPRQFREDINLKVPSTRGESPTVALSSSSLDKQEHVEEEDTRYAHFRRMLKLGAPRAKIEFDMSNLGLNPAGLDGPVPIDVAPVKAPTPEVLDTPRDNVVRRKWHFQEDPPADRASAPPGGSVWSRRCKRAQLPDSAKERIQRFFTKTTDSSEAEVERKSSGSADHTSEEILDVETTSLSAKRGSVLLLKQDKALTLEIALNSVKVSFSTVAEELTIFSGSSLEEIALKTILSMWPSMAEQRALDEYTGHFDSLGKCEQFLVTIRNVPRAKEKLQCLLLKKEFPRRIHELREMTLLVIRAINQINASSEFERLLHIILDVANYLNWGEASGEHRERISMDSFAKLSHTKSFNGSLTLLDCVVDCIQLDYGWNLTDLLNGFKLIEQCKAVSVDALNAEIEQLRKGHKMLVAESQPTASLRGPTKYTFVDEDTFRSRQALREFASIMSDELNAAQKLLDDLENSKATFLSKFEQNKRTSLDRHLIVIAQLVAELKASAAKTASVNRSALQESDVTAAAELN